MKAITGQFVIQSFCSDGGYGNAEERPERQSESREGGTVVSLFFCAKRVLPCRAESAKPRGPGQSPGMGLQEILAAGKPPSGGTRSTPWEPA